MAECACLSQVVWLNIYTVSQDSLPQSSDENLLHDDCSKLEKGYNYNKNVPDFPQRNGDKEKIPGLPQVSKGFNFQLSSEIYEAQGQLESLPANFPIERETFSKSSTSEYKKKESEFSGVKYYLETGNQPFNQLKGKILTSKKSPAFINKNTNPASSDRTSTKNYKQLKNNSSVKVYAMRYEKVKSKQKYVTQTIKGNNIWSTSTSSRSKWENLRTPQAFLYRTSSSHSFREIKSSGKAGLSRSLTNFMAELYPEYARKASILKDPNKQTLRGSFKKVSFKESLQELGTHKKHRYRDLCFAAIVAAIVVIITTAILFL